MCILPCLAAFLLLLHRSPAGDTSGLLAHSPEDGWSGDIPLGSGMNAATMTSSFLNLNKIFLENMYRCKSAQPQGRCAHTQLQQILPNCALKWLYRLIVPLDENCLWLPISTSIWH